MVLALASIFHIPSCKSDKDAGDGGKGGLDDVVPVSGSRLKVSWLEHDGERLAQPLFDTELQVPCSFEYVGPQELRCVPTHGDSVWFADADCTQPIMQKVSPSDSECITGPRYGRSSGWSSCEDDVWQISVFEPTDVPSTPATLHAFQDGDCVELVEEALEMVEAVPIPAETFVGAERRVEPRTSRLGVEWYDAEDGTRVPVGIFDLEEDHNCSAIAVGAPFEGEWYCIGEMAYSDAQGHYGYGDDECATLVGATYRECGEPDAIYLYDRDPDGCIQTSLHEVGEPIEQFYSESDGTCGVGEDHPDNQARRFEVGGTLEGAPAVERVVLGAGRIQAEYYTAESVNLKRTGGIYDAELETTCSAQPLANGKLVCLPNGTNSVSEGIFADADCTRPAVSWHVTGSCPGQTSLNYVVEMEHKPCESTLTALYAVGDQVDAVYSSFEDQCTVIDFGDGTVWYEVGDELDPEEVFATLDVVQDP